MAKKVLWIFGVMAGLALLLLYLNIDPADPVYGRWFPKCMVYTLTGWKCPSCGVQRAFHTLLQGDVVGALRQNWFLIFSGAYLAGMGISRLFSSRWPAGVRFFWGRAGGLCYISVYLLWFLVRNLAGL